MTGPARVKLRAGPGGHEIHNEAGARRPASYPFAGMGRSGCAPFCQAAVPAAIAVRAWVHFSLASSLGGTSISLITGG